MPGQTKVPDQDENRERVFRGDVFRSHYSHVKVGYRRLAGCAFCEGGLGAVVSSAKEEIRATPVDEDSGSDQEGTATHPSSDEAATGGEGNLQRQAEWWRA